MESKKKAEQPEASPKKELTEASPEKSKHSAEELKDLLQRTQANFENYRKQVEKRMLEHKDLATKELILELIPVQDNLELAFKTPEQNLAQFREGIELIYTQLNKILENNQVKVINTKNQPFDPYLHEALLKVESDQPEGRILEEFQKGFVLNGKVIRPAKVKVSSGKKIEPKISEKIKDNPKEE